MKKNPLIIVVGESDHGDMSYGSLVEKILKNAAEKNLKAQIFSEFPNQSDKVNTQSLLNVPSEEAHKETTEFLDSQMIKMGDLKGRSDLYDQTLEENRHLTKNQFFEKFKDNIDFPDLKTLFEQQAPRGDDLLVTTKSIDDQRGQFYWFGPAAFHSQKIHNDMAQDVRNGLNPKSDVIIVIAGSPHLPGLFNLLDKDFANCKKCVISNPNNRRPNNIEPIHTDATPEALSNIGELSNFEIDSETKEAIIPDIITKALEEKWIENRLEKNNFSEKFSDKNKAKEFEDIDDKKSWVEKISAKNQSRDDSSIPR